MSEKGKNSGSSHREIFNKINNLIYTVTEYIKYFLAACIIIGVIISLWSIPKQLSQLFDVESESLIAFLRYSINMLIALELIHLLCRQTMDAVVEVLLIAATRELIINELETWQMLVGVLAIGALFAIRKYLYISASESNKTPSSRSGDSVDPDK